MDGKNSFCLFVCFLKIKALQTNSQNFWRVFISVIHSTAQKVRLSLDFTFQKMTGNFSIFSLTKKEWDMAKLFVRTDGHWSLFIDPNTNETLNSPQLPTETSSRLSTLYRHKQKAKKKPISEPNPLCSPPSMNYTEFRPRSTLHHIPTKEKSVIKYKRDCDPPQQLPSNYFVGDNRRHKLSRSSEMVHEMRRDEEIQKLIGIRIERDKSKTVTGSRPSLYQRSLKPKETQYRWPRDFSHFSIT